MSIVIIVSKSGYTIHRWQLEWDGIVPAMRRTCSSSNLQSTQNTEDDLKILLWVLFYKPLQTLLPYHILVTCPFMRGYRLTQSEYALQKKVESFGDLIFRRAPFNPHLRRRRILFTIRWYGLSSTSVRIYTVVTLRRIFQRSCLSARGIIHTQEASINHWVDVPRSALEEGQEVES